MQPPQMSGAEAGFIRFLHQKFGPSNLPLPPTVNTTAVRDLDGFTKLILEYNALSHYDITWTPEELVSHWQSFKSADGSPYASSEHLVLNQADVQALNDQLTEMPQPPMRRDVPPPFPENPGPPPTSPGEDPYSVPPEEQPPLRPSKPHMRSA